jgi:hypothetical protein
MDQPMMEFLRPRMDEILKALPAGFEFRTTSSGNDSCLRIDRQCSEFKSEDEMREWFVQMVNAMVNVLRPVLKEGRG